jgi:hypothetical protein
MEPASNDDKPEQEQGEREVPFMTVSSGGPDIDDGVYPVTLTAIEGPKTITPQNGPNAGQDVDIFEWAFVVDEGDYENTEIQATTSTASGPRSKMFAFLTALLDGKAPQVGTSFEVTDLVGRRALATIRRSESGWPRIENLGALPAQMRTAPAQAAPEQAPAAAPAPAARRAYQPRPVGQSAPAQAAPRSTQPF